MKKRIYLKATLETTIEVDIDATDLYEACEATQLAVKEAKQRFDERFYTNKKYEDDYIDFNADAIDEDSLERAWERKREAIDIAERIISKYHLSVTELEAIKSLISDAWKHNF